MLPPVSNRSLGVILLTWVGCFSVVVLITYSLIDGNEDDLPRIVDQRRSIAHLRQTTSSRGQRLKLQYEKEYPPSDTQRIRNYVDSLRHADYATQPDLPYDIHACPPTPPPDYPYNWGIMDVIGNWNPGNTTEPNSIHQSLCIFDYQTDMDKAEAYREREVPFLVRNTPELLQTAERWSRSPDYLSRQLAGKSEKTEWSHTPHFMYFKLPKRSAVPKGWKQPMENPVAMDFDDWHRRAMAVQTDDYHQDRWYFRVNAVPSGPHDWLYSELSIFDPSTPSFWMVDPHQQRGINCRFGMKGVIAELHYDQSRNFIVVMNGQRRYILAHPKECAHLYLYPLHHPSGRHSAVDWIAPNLTQFPNFHRARVNELVLQAGDALYLPTYWFHFIVSLNLNYQCNARSGMTHEHDAYIQHCGFPIAPE